MKSKIICLILGIAIGMLSIFTLALKNENFRTFTKINASDKEIILEQNNQIDDLKTDKENLIKELASTTALKNQYLNEKNQLQEAVKSLNTRINNLNNELSDANNKLTSTESELATAKLQLETISSTLSQKETELLQKQKELEESIANGELQAEEIEQKQLEISNLQADINSLQTEKSNLEKTIESLTLEKTSLEQQIIDLNNEVDSLRSENNTNLETISNLENEIETLNTEILELETELEKYENEPFSLTVKEETFLECHIETLDYDLYVSTGYPQRISSEILKQINNTETINVSNASLSRYFDITIKNNEDNSIFYTVNGTNQETICSANENNISCNILVKVYAGNFDNLYSIDLIEDNSYYWTTLKVIDYQTNENGVLTNLNIELYVSVLKAS